MLVENEKKMLEIFVNHEQDKLTENNSGLHLAPLTSGLTVREPIFIRILFPLLIKKQTIKPKQEG